jgi:hypothetical protein
MKCNDSKRVSASKAVSDRSLAAEKQPLKFLFTDYPYQLIKRTEHYNKSG